MDIGVAFTALVLLASVAGYFIMLALDHLQASRLARSGSRLERVYLRARIKQVLKQRRFERERNELSWNGYRKFEIARRVEEVKDIMSFYLVPHDRKALPPYLPGQYLTFRLLIPDSVKYPGGQRREAKPVIRCYSLSDSPNHPDHYRVTVKKVGPPPGKPEVSPGLVSGFFHECLTEGRIVDVKAPAGQFSLDIARQTPIVLIAGGIGITPVLSMLNAVAEAHYNREAWFFYGVRNRAEHIMKDELERMVRENENIHLEVCYSDPLDGEVQGRDYRHAERVSVSLLKRLLPSSNYEFYICGPPPMMNQITQELAAWGVPQDRIFFEAFGPATVKKLAPAEPPAAEAGIAASYQVSFARSGKTCSWKPGTASLLEFAEANGVAIDFGCRAGNCGTCITAIKSGEISYLVDHGAKPEAGSCLACISVPKTDLVLDA